MKNYYKVALILVIALFMGFKAANAEEIAFEKGSFNEVLAKAKTQNKIVMIDFITDWCIWCKQLDMRVYTNKEVVDYANAHQVNWKTDAEKEGVDLAKKYNVTGFPTLVFVDADGNEIDKIVGFYPAKDFLEMIKKINDGKSTLTYFQNYQKNNPADLKANLDLANKLIEAGKTDDAAKYLKYIIEQDAQNAAGYTDDAEFNLAMLSDKNKKAETYIADVNALLIKYPETNLDKDAKFFLGDKYPELKQEDESLKLYNELAVKYPDDEMLKIYTGFYYMGKARSVMNDSAATKEQIADALNKSEMGMPYLTGGIFEASLNNIKSALYYKLGDMENAKKSVDRAIELWPDNKTYNKQKNKVYGTK